MYDFINEILGDGGAFSKESSNYQPRPQQIQMAMAVKYAIVNEKHALIEAGTGTGKTFAYLVPAIEASINNGKTIVISTKTKNLQSQIVNKDIPFLQRILPYDFKAEKVIGIGNFICFHRLKKHLKTENIEDIKNLRSIVNFFCNDRIKFSEIFELVEAKKTLLDEVEVKERSGIKRINAILDETDDTEDDTEDLGSSYHGTKEEIDLDIDSKTWGEICAESDSCHRKNCPFFNDCYYFKAKERQKAANILIVNHSLFFADLAVRKGSGFAIENAVIPKFDVVIFDEAHDVENVAANFMGMKISNFRLKHYINSLAANINNNKALRKIVGNDYISKTMGKMLEDLTLETTAFFNDVREIFRNEKVVRIRKKNFVDSKGIIEVLKKVQGSIDTIIEKIDSSVDGNMEAKDLSVLSERTDKLISDIQSVVGMVGEDWAYWAEIGPVKVSLCGSPVDIAKELKSSLFGRISSCILASATLSVNNSFDFVCNRLGVDINRIVQLTVGSPFNYHHQAMLCIPEDSMEPTVENSEEFAQHISKQIKRIMKISEGRAFILFTSYKLMDDTYNLLKEVLEDWGYPCFKQTSECSREKLLKDFLENDNSILFGAESFWQGIDVPGDKLSCVIIPKIPFANPSDPLVAARLDHIKKNGLNAFMVYSLPDSIIRLKQGTGRLIRTEKDMGAVVILDKRVLTKMYGGNIVRSLPNYYQTKKIDDIALVFNKKENKQEENNE